MDIRACTDGQSALRDGPAGDAMIAQQLPRHTDLSVTQAMSVFFAALDAGESVLIRPRAAFDGLDRVIEALSRRASGRLFVTDLESIGDMVENPYGSGTDSNDPTHEPFLAYHTSGSTGSPKCVVYRHDQAPVFHDGADDGIAAWGESMTVRGYDVGPAGAAGLRFSGS